METKEQLPLQSQSLDTKTNFFTPLFKVTTLSKCVALALFIILPITAIWVGFNMGYQTGYENTLSDRLSWSLPTEPFNDVPAIRQESVAGDTSLAFGKSKNFYFNSSLANTIPESPTYIFDKDSFIAQLKDNQYVRGPVAEEAFGPFGEFSLQITKLSNTLVIADLHSPSQGLFVSVIFDESSNKIIKQNPFQNIHDFYVTSPIFWTHYKDQAYLVVIDCPVAKNCQPTVTLYDFYTGTSTLLYKETRQNVLLAEVCEMGCTGGLLGETFDGDILVGLYSKPFIPLSNPIFATYYETIKVPLPNEFKVERKFFVDSYNIN